MKDLEYETKCRRCGEIYIWWFGNTPDIRYEDFRYSMYDKIQVPRLIGCRKCDRATVQDIVAYTSSVD